MGSQRVGNNWATELNWTVDITVNKRGIPFISNEHGKSDGSFFYLFFQSMSSMLSVLEEKQRCIKTGPFKLPAHGKYARFQTEFQHNSTFWFANMRIFFFNFFLYLACIQHLLFVPNGPFKLCMGEVLGIYDTTCVLLESLSKGINSSILYTLSPYIPSGTYKWHK